MDRDHLLEWDETLSVRQNHKPEQDWWDLDPSEPGEAGIRVPHEHRHVEGEVGDIREWVGRVDRQRCHYGEHEFPKLIIEERPIVIIEGRIVAENDAFAAQCRSQLR